MLLTYWWSSSKLLWSCFITSTSEKFSFHYKYQNLSFIYSNLRAGLCWDLTKAEVRKSRSFSIFARIVGFWNCPKPLWMGFGAAWDGGRDFNPLPTQTILRFPDPLIYTSHKNNGSLKSVLLFKLTACVGGNSGWKLSSVWRNEGRRRTEPCESPGQREGPGPALPVLQTQGRVWMMKCSRNQSHPC